MVRKVRWSDKAASDRKNIAESNKKSGARFAKSEDDKIKKGVDTIRLNNAIGLKNLHPKGILYILEDKYKILYRIDAGVISIERIFW
ncbi:type II toxin-antitoxin system RelE/ParE family toxin [Duffyella gerundensis]|uniref:type II toxin-antitoxin system RelE/ParE family toxin n=1 Tax=Duffyella gerundensis TaxID=1619313 RepID=UPI001654547A|nr:type II toxin-antitoxin system RelE/ParE family toxin [Duffyella gerundensis]